MGECFEPKASDGIEVGDRVDISTLGLKDLRSKISIIPQDPTVFSGAPHTYSHEVSSSKRR